MRLSRTLQMKNVAVAANQNMSLTWTGQSMQYCTDSAESH